MFDLATKFIPERPHFQIAIDAGFRATEFWLSAKLLSQTKEIATVAAEFPFRYALHFPNGGSIAPSELKSTVELYHELNCTAIVIHQPMFKKHGQALLDIDSTISLAIENHKLDPAGFESWAEESRGLTLDVEHLWEFTLPGASFKDLLAQIDRFLDRHAKKLQHVHLLGYHPGGEEHLPVHRHPELAIEVWDRLASHGFGKLVVSEADLPYQTRESLEKDVALFDGWLQAHVR